MTRYLIIMLLIVTFNACRDQKGFVAKDENNGDEIVTVEEDDKEMNEAIRRAKSTYSDFLAKMSKADSADEDFTVKVEFAYDGGSEHMWLVDLHYKERKLYGVLDSDPASIDWVRSGDRLEIKHDSISDWMYVRNGKLIGGYTIKAIYNKMTPEEKKKLEAEVPFKIE